MKGLVEFTSYVTFLTFLIIAFSVVFVTGFIGHTQVVASYESADEELNSIAAMNKLISSKSCFSSGEAGILDWNLVDGKDDMIKLLCIDDLDYDYSVIIETDDEIFEYGFSREVSWDPDTEREYYISINNYKGTGETIPGKINLQLRDSS